MKIRVAVIFGGSSVEHEVSVISALQAVASMDPEKYEITPVYLTKNNEMYVGYRVGDIDAYRDIPNLIRISDRVILINDQGKYYIEDYPKKIFRGFGKQEIDIVFPIVHGTNVEDGTLMGYLKTIGVPFVGCDVTAAAVGMDKYIMKMVFKDNGIPVLDCIRFNTSDYKEMNSLLDKVEEKLSYPVIIKPVNSGSSVGISVANNRDELIDSVDEAFTFANQILVERAIKDLQEINCSVLGDADEAEASLCEEPFHSKDILSYEDKYLSGGGKGAKGAGKSGGASKGMASVSRKIPAEIPDEMTERIRRLAVRAFMALNCNGVVRFDFMIDKSTNELYLNEINTIPGSLSFYLWEPTGLSYPKLLDRMIELGIKRQRDNERVTFSFETNILNQASLGGLKGSKNKVG